MRYLLMSFNERITELRNFYREMLDATQLSIYGPLCRFFIQTHQEKIINSIMNSNVSNIADRVCRRHP